MNEVKSRVKKLIEFIFYGNYFYGVCVVAMLFETVMQLHLSLDGPFMYVMVFFATVLFYNYPYARLYKAPSTNPRTRWYMRHHRFVMANQVVFTIVVVACCVWVIIKHSGQIKEIGAIRMLLLLIFPVAGGLYYGSNFLTRKYNLRQIGWLKPFVIGFVWAGVVNVYPILYADLIHGTDTQPGIQNVMLFFKTGMFISMLAIMFDIKDYAEDNKEQLNTLIVKIGIRKTLFFVIIPLTLLGLLTFFSYAITHQFSIWRMILIMIPFLLLIASTLSFRKRRTLLYYLIVIDGLMLVKALFGSIAMFVDN